MLEIDTLNYEPLSRDGIALPGRVARWRDCRIWRGAVDDLRRFPLYIKGHNGRQVIWNGAALLCDAANNPSKSERWDDFYGGISADDRAALVNDQAATDLVSSLVDSFALSLPAPESIKMQRHWCDADGELCAGRYFDGADNAFRRWRRDRRVPQAGLIVRVTFTVGGTSEKSVRQIAITGAAGLALCVLLERAGYRCELAGGWYSSRTFNSYPFDCLTFCDIKAAEHPLDVASVASVFASESMRQCVFSSRYCMVPGGDCRRSLGQPKGFLPTWAKGDIALSACFDKESAKRAISDALAPYMASAAA